MRIVIGAAVLAFTLSGLDPAAAQVQPAQDRVNTALARARQVGIPVALLESKIAEGKAKGVSIDRIAVAVERRLAALERASEVTKGQPAIGDADLAVAADALQSGVSEGVLRALTETAPPGRRAVAIAALTQLVELGHAPETALERVRDALKRGSDALVNLPAEAGGAAGRRGGPPAVTPGAGGGRGQGGPPAGVPAPGGASQPTRPGRGEDSRGRAGGAPAAGRGGGV